MEEENEVTPSSSDEKDKKLLSKARDDYKNSDDFYSDIRDQYEDDIEFYGGENHWSDDIKSVREGDGQPVLVINRMPGFIRQVTNDFRQNRPAVKVKPADNDADPETAEIFQGLIRNIEAVSHADDAYDCAFFNAVAASFGFFRIITDYIDDSFEQEIRIEPISNPLMVRYDPLSRRYDGSDSSYWFVEQTMTVEEFKREWPGEDPDNWEDDEKADGWYEGDTVRIAEYYYYDYKKDTLCLLQDGKTVYKSDLEDKSQVVEERETQRKTIKWAKLAGASVLERGDWAGKLMPIVPMFGDMVDENGDLKIYSLIRFAKDSQRMYNYFRSAEAELIALQPKAPYIGAEGQFEGFEEDWQQANRVPFSFLEYKPTTVGGQLAPPPQRQVFASPPSGVLQGGVNADQDMMATTGIHEASLGQQGNETSGRAIMARQAEGDTSTYHFRDNASKSMRRCGEVLVDLIPNIYDTPRVVRVLGEDGVEKMVPINQPTMEKDKHGQDIERIYDVNVGRYDVICSSGASYASRREEAKESMVQVLQANPDLWPIAGDILVEAMDWPQADDLAERMRKMLPPELKEPEEGEPPQLPPEVQEQMAQMEQAIGEMNQVIETMSEELESNKIEELKQLNEQMKIENDTFKLETERMTAENSATDNDLT